MQTEEELDAAANTALAEILGDRAAPAAPLLLDDSSKNASLAQQLLSLDPSEVALPPSLDPAAEEARKADAAREKERQRERRERDRDERLR